MTSPREKLLSELRTLSKEAICDSMVDSIAGTCMCSYNSALGAIPYLKHNTGPLSMFNTVANELQTLSEEELLDMLPNAPTEDEFAYYQVKVEQFECRSCGWWSYPGENSSGCDICDDCSEEEEEED